MTIRQRVWTDKTGQVQRAWEVDIQFQHPNGRVERVRRHSPVDSKRGAERYEHEIRSALLDGTWGKPAPLESPRLKDFAERWLKHSRAANKPSAANSKAIILRRHLLPTLGELALDQITLQRIDALKVEKLDAGLSKKTVNNVLAVLGALLRQAHAWGELSIVPAYKLFKVPPAPFDFLTYEEAETLTAAAKLEGGRWYPMVVLALNTGLRIGELSALRWDAVDLKNGRLVVRQAIWKGVLSTPKGGREREIPLNEPAARALREIQRKLGVPWVFPNQFDGVMQREHACVEAILRIAKRAGLRPLGWHVLRHTFASHLVMRGVNLRAVQVLLGHSTYAMTERYAHLAPDVKKDAVRVLEQRPAKKQTEEEAS